MPFVHCRRLASLVTSPAMPLPRFYCRGLASITANDATTSASINGTTPALLPPCYHSTLAASISKHKAAAAVAGGMPELSSLLLRMLLLLDCLVRVVGFTARRRCNFS
jgi:hypothetical protein